MFILCLLEIGIYKEANLIFLFIFRMTNNDDYLVQLPESIALTQNINYNIPVNNAVSFIFEYKSQRHWAKVYFPYDYEMFEAKGINVEFN